MTSHTAPAAVSDQIMAKRSVMHHSTGQAVHLSSKEQLGPCTEHTEIIRMDKVFLSGKCPCTGVAKEQNENIQHVQLNEIKAR